MAHDEGPWRWEPPAEPAPRSWLDTAKTYAALGGLGFGIVSAAWTFGGVWATSQGRIDQLDKAVAGVKTEVVGVKSELGRMSGKIELLVQRTGWGAEVRRN